MKLLFTSCVLGLFAITAYTTSAPATIPQESEDTPEDPDFWPVFIAHGPAGGGAVSAWDFSEAVKFWFDGQHANHGFFLHGDSNDYMRVYTPRVKDIKLRPAIMVVYDPKKQ